MIVVGALNLNIVQILISLFIGILLWFGAISASKDNPLRFKVSVLVAAILCVPFSYRLVSRVLFVLEHGGMEGLDGYGSPLAFLIGLFFESLIFIPLFLLFIYGFFLVIRGRLSNA